MTDPLRPFDVPAAGSDKPDATRLLIGQPNPEIGAVTHAWSNVPARPQKRRGGSGPAIVMGVLGGLVGMIVVLSVEELPVSGFIVVLGFAVLAGVIGMGLSRVLGAAMKEQDCWYVGARGLQHNAISFGRITTVTFPFEANYAVVERGKKDVYYNNAYQRTTQWTRLDMVTRGGDANFVPPTIFREACAQASQARLRAIQSGGERTFGVFDRPLNATPQGHWNRSGTLTLESDALELKFGNTTKRAPLRELRVELKDGRMSFTWGTERAETELRKVGDVAVLLELLAAHGRVLGMEE